MKMNVVFAHNALQDADIFAIAYLGNNVATT